MSMTPSQPYLLRAIYDWIVDNQMTPYVLVNAENDYAYIPRDYVENGKIVLNIGPIAVNALDLGNDYVAFNARFASKPMEVSFPVNAVLAIYAKENGQGMVFNESDDMPPPDDTPDDDSKSGKPNLKLVK
ncbi:ClpXP protease specificity-enhancing factor [Thiohalophilus sp.]|uniref:ClpXP protease specificity-enhancing factor n=1 Tax=Thiohalophilus sp. TaxID=3028392 RepID=UPI002ACE3EF4|nr:ClpXP protease specificity-enhancing factor [Thiohalophilus sp.]MDZ7662299.1 ClpXP protease specificity-enhancing factor [Thiohalophilus sp.]